MPMRSRENHSQQRPAPGLALQRAEKTHRGCFKTLQALAQCPRPGLGRFHHASAGQVCLVPHQHACPKETTRALRLTGGLGGSWREERAERAAWEGRERWERLPGLRRPGQGGPAGRSGPGGLGLSPQLMLGPFLDILCVCLPRLLEAASARKERAKLMRAFALMPNAWSKL